MKKHAVCILAHKNWSQLDDLIDTLGEPLVDIYLHIDLKGRDDFDKYAESNSFERHKNVHIIESVDVSWGGIHSFA